MSIPITTRLIVSFICSSDARPITGCRTGRATLLRTEQTLVSLSLPWGDARTTQAKGEPHDESWAADVRATAWAPRPSLARRRSWGQ